MTRSIAAGLLAGIMILALSGCTMQMPPPPQPTMSLEEAMASVGRSLVTMKKAELGANDGKEFATGLMPYEAEVTLVISAAKVEQGKLYVSLAAPITALPKAKENLSGGAEASTTSTAAAANTIRILFRNIFFAAASKEPCDDGHGGAKPNEHKTGGDDKPSSAAPGSFQVLTVADALKLLEKMDRDGVVVFSASNPVVTDWLKMMRKTPNAPNTPPETPPDKR